MESIFLPERLKKIRENRGLNKAEAARLLGLSKMGYLRYESAARTPSYLTGKTDNPEPNEYVISKSDDSALFELITDMIDIKNPVRTRLLAYYKKLKTGSDRRIS